MIEEQFVMYIILLLKPNDPLERMPLPPFPPMSFHVIYLAYFFVSPLTINFSFLLLDHCMAPGTRYMTNWG